MLDIAAGHGMYGITLARQNAQAHITAVDWRRCSKWPRKMRTKPGWPTVTRPSREAPLKTDLGDGYDLVLLTNIFHHFDKPTCVQLMQRVHHALKPNGKAITLEFVPDEDRISPPTAAGFSLLMLAATDARDAYTLSEYDEMFQSAGFAKTALHAIPETPQQLLVSEKIA